MKREDKQPISWPQGIAAAFLVGSVGWFSSTVTSMYREGGATAAINEDNHRLMEQRNRENDDIKAIDRLLLEHALMNCVPSEKTPPGANNESQKGRPRP